MTEIRKDINCKEKSCMNVWKVLVNLKKEKDGELKLFLEDCLENIELYISAYDLNKTLLARDFYILNIRRNIKHLNEYCDTGNIKECPRRGY